METVNHPFHDYDTIRALALARSYKYGPLPKPTDPTPSVDEAVEIIHAARLRADFNWITGRVAEEVLRATRGEKDVFTT